jgi:hypothetical protein
MVVLRGVTLWSHYETNRLCGSSYRHITGGFGGFSVNARAYSTTLWANSSKCPHRDWA